jgi:hypothetical protein
MVLFITLMTIARPRIPPRTLNCVIAAVPTASGKLAKNILQRGLVADLDLVYL